jgi:ubiquinone/menaquinone biosynthesis C-methylase UbiE
MSGEALQIDPRAEQVGTFFDGEAARYDAAHDEAGPGRHALRVRMNATLELLGGQGGAVLDAGMGPGRLLEELDRRGFEVSGGDVSDEMVARARERVPTAASRLVRADLEALPFPDESFDAVVATGVLEYVPDLPQALHELARVLRPGGVAVVSAPNPGAAYAIWRRNFYRLVRLVKRYVRTGRPAPPPGTRIPTRSLQQGLAREGLRCAGIRHVNYQIALTPLDALLPGPSVRVAERLEGSPAWLGRLLATQVVIRAEKPASTEGVDR